MTASMTGMTVEPSPIVPATPCVGFVIAMRARLITARGPPRQEWIIVSRWGGAGEHLSIARTRVAVAAGRGAPIHLAPRQTALAGLLRLPPVAGPATFLFAQDLPDEVRLAGQFAAVEGYVRLLGRAGALRLRAEGRCAVGANRAAWRVEAARGAWIGEFVESAG